MGQPFPHYGGKLKSESIGLQSDTRGSETSQVPCGEENKQVIPSVVASERGRA